MCVLKWTEETCRQAAMKCKTRSEFASMYSSAYQVACRNGWINKWFVNLRGTAWTMVKCLQEARKYKTKGEFARKNPNAYQVARRKGWLEKWFEDQRYKKHINF